jgi:hypothetical protein
MLAALLVGAVADHAMAQDKAVPNKAVLDHLDELNRQALADYAADDFESARLGLREAITLAGRSGLAADPIMAHLWADLGALYLNGFHDKPKGQKALSLALKIRADARPSDSMLTPEVKEALAALVPPTPVAPATNPAAPASPAPAPVGTPAPPVAGTPVAPAAKPAVAKRKRGAGTEPDLPANIPQPLYCPTVDEAPPEQNVVLYCVLAPDIEAKKVTLFYRSAGAERWASAGTSKSELGWWKAVLPGDAITGKSVQFYLEARDPAGKVVGRAGRDDSPNLLFVREGAASLAGGVWAGMQAARKDDGSEQARADEDPLEAVVRQREEERFAAGIHRRRPGAVFIGASLGSGYGWHPRENLEFYETGTIEPGWIPSGLLHVLPFIGYQLSESWALSAEGRIQYIPQSGSGDRKQGSPAAGAFLLMARLQYFLGRGNLQGTASLLAGAGDGFRLTIGPQTEINPPQLRNDSVRGGPFVLGAGGGLIYHLSPHLGLVADVRALLGLGDQAVVIDGSGGLAIAF